MLFCRLDVIPGFQTSILQYERDVLLEIDVAHKILRTESVLDFMYGLYNRARRDDNMFKQMCTKMVIGAIVLTR
jgi:aubergine-like protein